MARGRKNLTLDEQLAKITKEIENMERSIQEMKKTKTELERQIKINRLTELDELISSRGLTVEDIREMLDDEYEDDEEQED